MTTKHLQYSIKGLLKIQSILDYNSQLLEVLMMMKKIVMVLNKNMFIEMINMMQV